MRVFRLHQICTKGVPENMNPFASLIITYLVSAAQIVTSSILGVILIIVGYVGYKEAITWNKIVGVIVCLAGLGLINLEISDKR